MPYQEDGETWDENYDEHYDGMAENKPGHKPFTEYNLPRWAKHPLTHPFSGAIIEPKDYAYHSAKLASSCRGDGIGNHHDWNTAHVACMSGDMEMLEAASEEELSQRTTGGHTPAHYCVIYGTPWCLQWLVERGANTTSRCDQNYTPRELIWAEPRNHQNEKEWLDAALKGELDAKKSNQAQDYKIKKHMPEALDVVSREFAEKNLEITKKYMFNTGEYVMPYNVPGDLEVRERMDLPPSRIPDPPRKGKPPLPAALLFPGQGSQYPGMLKDVVHLPRVVEMFEIANRVLGWDLKQLVLNGPEDKLAETRHCQPAMFLAGMAAFELMREQKKEAADRPFAVAGLSLGEYTALCAAGVLSFEDALRLVKLRGEAMQAAADLRPQCMASVAGLQKVVLERLCRQAVDEDTSISDPLCQIANCLFEGGFVCAGTSSTVDRLCQLAKDENALQARVIKAGGAFHTPLMQPAQDQLDLALDQVRSKLQPPRCNVYFNVTGKKVLAGSNPAEFVGLLKRQLTSEVQWEATIRQMIMDGVKDFYEVGPLKQLKSMIKRIDQNAFKRTESISV